ncbi:hypothetical protein ACP26L_16620 [Paenibacillus sp. S-38]|uniref:rhamnogalacturonan endolyase family protein n=1 Tax=Paenibacillus sp. S-38 TaxID=3416710 RepID=UPI003CF3B249
MAFSAVVSPIPGYAASDSTPARQAEYLNRGLVAVLVDNGVFLSWRYLNTDPSEIRLGQDVGSGGAANDRDRGRRVA